MHAIKTEKAHFQRTVCVLLPEQAASAVLCLPDVCERLWWRGYNVQQDTDSICISPTTPTQKRPLLNPLPWREPHLYDDIAVWAFLGVAVQPALAEDMSYPVLEDMSPIALLQDLPPGLTCCVVVIPESSQSICNRWTGRRSQPRVRNKV